MQKESCVLTCQRNLEHSNIHLVYPPCSKCHHQDHYIFRFGNSNLNLPRLNPGRGVVPKYTPAVQPITTLSPPVSTVPMLTATTLRPAARASRTRSTAGSLQGAGGKSKGPTNANLAARSNHLGGLPSLKE